MNDTVFTAIVGTPFYKKVIQFCHDHGLFDGIGTFHIGLSGGADSTALTAVLAAYQRKCRSIGADTPDLTAHHIRHGLRDSDALDMAAAQKNAQLLGVRFICTELRLGPLQSRIEETARNARMAAFSSAIPPHSRSTSALALAHHGDENIETLLWRLARGCGLEGATLQPRSTDREGITRIRPLLCVGKDEIIRFLNAVGLDWAEDPTNHENHYLRNQLRHNVLAPYMDIFPEAGSVHTSLIRFADDASALSSFAEMNAIAATRLHTCLCRREHFERLSHAAQLQFLRHAARHCVPGHTPDAHFITRAHQMLLQHDQKHRIETNQTVICSFNRLYIWVSAAAAPVFSPAPVPCPLPAENTDIWSLFSITLHRFICEDVPRNTTDTLAFAWNDDMTPLTVVPAAQLTTMNTSDGRTRPIREHLRNAHIPEPLMDCWPVLTCSDGPLWIFAGPRSDIARPPSPGERSVSCRLHSRSGTVP